MCRNPIGNQSFSVAREKKKKIPRMFHRTENKKEPWWKWSESDRSFNGHFCVLNIRGQCLSEHWSSLSRSWKASFVPAQCSPLLNPPFLKCCLPKASALCGWMLGGNSERKKPVSVFRDSLGSEDSLSHRFGCLLILLNLQHQNNPSWIKMFFKKNHI